MGHGHQGNALVDCHCCPPCRYCLPADTLDASGNTFQVEVAGIVNPAPPPPDYTPFNGTFPLFDGLGGSTSKNMADFAFREGAVDHDPNYSGNIQTNPALVPDGVYCALFAPLPGYDPTGGGGFGNDNGVAVSVLFYGTLGGGLSAVVLMLSGTGVLVYENIVLSPTSRRFDCAALDVLAAALTSFRWSGGVLPGFSPAGVSIRISTV